MEIFLLIFLNIFIPVMIWCCPDILILAFGLVSLMISCMCMNRVTRGFLKKIKYCEIACSKGDMGLGKDKSTKFFLSSMIFILTWMSSPNLEKFYPSGNPFENIFETGKYYVELLPFLPIVILIRSIFYDHPLDYITGQWIFKKYGLNSRSAIWRTIWISLISIGVLLVYAKIDILNLGGSKASIELQRKLYTICKPTDPEEFYLFIIDNCAAEFPRFFGFLIGGFFVILGFMQAEFISKYRLLHEIRRDAFSKMEGEIPGYFGYSARFKSPHYLYYIEHCFRFTMNKNSSFKQEVKECLDYFYENKNTDQMKLIEKYKELKLAVDNHTPKNPKN